MGDIVRDDAFGLTLSDPNAHRLLREVLSGDRGQPEQLLLDRPALIKLIDSQGGEWIASLMQLVPHSQTQAAFERVGRSARAALFVRRAEAVPRSGVEACANLYGLTPSEMRVLQAALDIHTVAEMASALGVSPNTIKKHLSAIFAKMGVSRRAGLICVAAISMRFVLPHPRVFPENNAVASLGCSRMPHGLLRSCPRTWCKVTEVAKPLASAPSIAL
jgi:DNA-binding CsgD family transcriptional regulator